jgi:hypothetical protein
VVDLLQYTHVIALVVENSNQFKDSIAIILPLERWFLGAHAHKFSKHHQQCQAGSGKGASATMC